MATCANQPLSIPRIFIVFAHRVHVRLVGIVTFETEFDLVIAVQKIGVIG
jgi:hypothetical protein